MHLPDSEDGRDWVWQVLQQVATITIPHLHMKGLFKATPKALLACDGQALNGMVMNITMFGRIRRSCNRKKIILVLNMAASTRAKLRLGLFETQSIFWRAYFRSILIFKTCLFKAQETFGRHFNSNLGILLVLPEARMEKEYLPKMKWTLIQIFIID